MQSVNLNALKKPNLLIPLSANASRGDQILNARSFERQGFSMVLEEEEITESTLFKRNPRTVPEQRVLCSCHVRKQSYEFY